MSKWKHDDLQADLAEHLLTPERLVWQDMQIGMAGSPRPDVYTIKKSYSKPHPISYEIKVSKSDFLSDMKTGKWQSYLQFSCAVVFCVPKGLITKADLPAGCGLMVRDENGWHTLKAPKLERAKIPENAFMKLLIDGAERAQKSHIKRLKDEYRINSEAQKRFGGLVAEILADHQQVQQRIVADKHRLDYLMQQAQDQAKRIVDNAKNEAKEATALMSELAESLSLPPDSSIYLIRRAVADMKKSFSESSSLQSAIQSLERSKMQIESSLVHLKQLTGQQ